MKIAILSVSRKGFALSKKLMESYPEAVLHTSGSWRENEAQEIVPSLKELTGKLFKQMDALVFIMASGIAVRMIAPYLKGKASDPAVLVMDDHGKWVIPLLSGHIGGANELAVRIAESLGAQAVVTTATDGEGLTAVDMLAIRQGCVITSLEAAKQATAALLEGEQIGVYSWKPVTRPLPEGYYAVPSRPLEDEGWQVLITPYVIEPKDKEVWLVPRCITLGMGCRKDASFDAIVKLVEEELAEVGLDRRAVCRIASIDLKAEEPGLNRLAENLKVPLVTYPAEALAGAAPGCAQSDFVKRVTGVGAVAEPAGAVASGGRCLLPKRASNGVTLSIWEDC